MCCFFFNDTATTEIYTLSLHDALPICAMERSLNKLEELLAEQGSALTERPGIAAFLPVIVVEYLHLRFGDAFDSADRPHLDRKSTRLNSSHANISYAVFCLKKKNANNK